MTILHRAAQVEGSMKRAKALEEKCPSVTQIKDADGYTLLYQAICVSHDSNLVWYLASVTTNEGSGYPFSDPHAAVIFCALMKLQTFLLLLGPL